MTQEKKQEETTSLDLFKLNLEKNALAQYIRIGDKVYESLRELRAFLHYNLDPQSVRNNPTHPQYKYILQLFEETIEEIKSDIVSSY